MSGEPRLAAAVTMDEDRSAGGPQLALWGKRSARILIPSRWGRYCRKPMRVALVGRLASLDSAAQLVHIGESHSVTRRATPTP